MKALGWTIVNDDPAEFEIRASAERLPGMLFARVREAKTQKNRLHLDLRPDAQRVEVERLLGLGARRADVGQCENRGWCRKTRRATSSVC